MTKEFPGPGFVYTMPPGLKSATIFVTRGDGDSGETTLRVALPEGTRLEDVKFSVSTEGSGGGPNR